MNEEYHICYCGWKVHTLTNKVILIENTVSLWYVVVSNTLHLEMNIIKTVRSGTEMESSCMISCF
jgi:ABC-type anion transport system duplicated permease subunit